MNYEFLFSLLSYSPGPFWLILLFIPTNKHAMKAFDLFLIALSLLFAVLCIPQVPELIPVIAEPEYGPIKAFLGTDSGFIGTWNHMILGDLWIARWIVYDAMGLGIRGWFRAPVVLLTMFFGPLGLAAYFLVRIAVTRKTFFFETNE